MTEPSAFDDLPMWQRLIWMSMTGTERVAFKRYAVMRGGDPVVAFGQWIKRHDADASPNTASVRPCNEHVEGCIASGVHRTHVFADDGETKSPGTNGAVNDGRGNDRT